jgi:hypothetical protein
VEGGTELRKRSTASGSGWDFEADPEPHGISEEQDGRHEEEADGEEADEQDGDWGSAADHVDGKKRQEDKEPECDRAFDDGSKIEQDSLHEPWSHADSGGRALLGGGADEGAMDFGAAAEALVVGGCGGRAFGVELLGGDEAVTEFGA